MVCPACDAAFCNADSAMPSDALALSSWNIGSTTPIMMSKPPPSAPRRSASVTWTPAALTGDEALPRRPRPSNGATVDTPAALAGTSQIVLAPSALTGLLDHT